MSSVTRVPTLSDPGEIDLFKLAHGVWRRRVFIVGMACLSTLLGSSYAYFVTPIFEASSLLRPVALNQLDALNRSQIYTLPPDEALKRVGAALDSYNTRLDFFRSRADLVGAFQSDGKNLEQAFEDFNKNTLSVLQPDPKKTDLFSSYVGLKMRYEKGIEGASILNDFVDYAVEQERIQLSNDLQIIQTNRLSEVDARLTAAVAEHQLGKEGRIARLEEADAIRRAELDDELKALRVQLRLGRDARLAQLEEAIGIARSLGLKKPSTPALMADEGTGPSNIVRTEINSQQAPLYFLGTDVLEAEQKALRRRTSDDFVEPRIAQIRKELIMLSTNRKVEVLKARESETAFLEGIEALRVERGRLERIDTSLHNLKLVSIDQRAVTSTEPVKPRKMLIVFGAFCAGLIFGILLALLRGAFKDHLRQTRVLEIEGSAKRVSATELPTVNVIG